MLDRNWKQIARKAWSFRLMIIAALLSGAEFLLPLLQPDSPSRIFAILSFLTVVAATAARLIAQREVSGNEN